MRNKSVAGRIADAVHAKGGKLVMQLWHVGGSLTLRCSSWQAPVSSTATAPMPNLHRRWLCGRVAPRALRLEEIPGIVNAYRQAARRAMDAGATVLRYMVRMATCSSRADAAHREAREAAGGCPRQLPGAPRARARAPGALPEDSTSRPIPTRTGSSGASASPTTRRATADRGRRRARRRGRGGLSATIALTREQAAAFAIHATQLVEAGRPVPLCGLPSTLRARLPRTNAIVHP